MAGHDAVATMVITSSGETCRALYHYTPSLALACVGIALFSIVTGAHIIRTVLTRTWDNIFFVIGGLCQTTGYIARAYSTQNLCNKQAYGAQSVLLLLGPTFLMFTVVLTHTRYIQALHAEAFCWVPVRFQRKIYLTLNTAFIVIQATGALELVTGTEMSLLEGGDKAIVAAYVMQMVTWGFILAENTTATIRFGRFVKRAEPGAASPVDEQKMLNAKTKFAHYHRWSQLFGLAISIIGFGRNLMRLTEQGVTFLQDNEWPGYAFDGYQMIIVMGAFAVFYLPAKVREVGRIQEYGREGVDMSPMYMR